MRVTNPSSERRIDIRKTSAVGPTEQILTDFEQMQRDHEAMNVLRARLKVELAFKYHPGGASTVMTMIHSDAAVRARTKARPMYYEDPADAILARAR